MGYMLNFTREHVVILGKTELLAFACLIFWDLDRLFMALFLEMPGGTTQETTQKTTQKLIPKQKAILLYLKGHPLAGREEIVQNILEIMADGMKYNLKRL